MQKIIVFGATGGVGKHVITEALQAGYQVTAVARNPAAILIKDPFLTVIKADVLQPLTFQNEMAQSDAVISCLGIPKIQQTTLYSAGMRNIVTAMKESGIKRIICISSGAINTPQGSSFIMAFLLKHVLQRLFRPVYSDMQLMEDILTESGLDWTTIGAPKLTDGKKTKNYRVITRQPLRSIPQISRADLAEFMVSHLADEKTYKARIEIAY